MLRDRSRHLPYRYLRQWGGQAPWKSVAPISFLRFFSSLRLGAAAPKQTLTARIPTSCQCLGFPIYELKTAKEPLGFGGL